CGDNKTSTSTPASASKTSTSTSKVEEKKDEPDARGMLNGKFVDTRHISVEIYDRGNDGGTDPTNNAWTDWIKAQMLDRYNVEVEFVKVGRWSEKEDISALLAAQNAPDVCYTYGYDIVQSFAQMGGVIDLKPLLDENSDLIPNVFDWLGDSLVYQDLDPAAGTLWAIEGKRNMTCRINTFVRKDWLDKLGLKEPTNKAEFEAMLVKFKENAETLLGADAARMVPFSISSDVGWRAANIIESFMDPDITDKELYVNGFDDRKFTENGAKEAIRLLNKWYNDGLVWKDFAIQASDSTAEDDMIKAGFVGAFIHNYDYPFRDGENSINYTLASLVDGGKFVAVNCFEDKNGGYTKYSYSNSGERKVFFPATNDEIAASLCYLEFMSQAETVEFLQTGEEGVNHTVDAATGAIVLQSPDEAHHEWLQNSGKNIDYTIDCNGMRLATEELTTLSLAYAYPFVDAEDVKQAIEAAKVDARAPKTVSVGDINAETEGVDLATKRDTTFAKAITASVADFDSVWDKGMAEYLQAGGQAIMDERKTAWEATYGTDTMLP
ncbi:MAG: extracellular solute-binding protein, partial [Lachnospiraceae bacterium]|nr:extracellular solute-binding protein [Lachnospiraceae bacterium]